jgi:hypothetical protein
MNAVAALPVAFVAADAAAGAVVARQDRQKHRRLAPDHSAVLGAAVGCDLGPCLRPLPITAALWQEKN